MIKEKEIFEVIKSFRMIFEKYGKDFNWGFDKFPVGCCTNTSLLLGIYIKYELNISNTFLMLGTINGVIHSKEKRHHWIKCNNKTIDITSDQYDDSDSKIIFSSNSIWHAKFNRISKQELQKITNYKIEFSRTYERIKMMVKNRII